MGIEINRNLVSDQSKKAVLVILEKPKEVGTLEKTGFLNKIILTEQTF